MFLNHPNSPDLRKYLLIFTKVLLNNLVLLYFDAMGMSARHRRHEEEERKRLTPVTPEDIRLVFDEMDIELTWDFMEKLFYLKKAEWRGLFEAVYAKSPRDITKMELFARFGLKHLKEPINKILFRHPDYEATWFEIQRHVVKHKLKERKKESNY